MAPVRFHVRGSRPIGVPFPEFVARETDADDVESVSHHTSGCSHVDPRGRIVDGADAVRTPEADVTDALGGRATVVESDDD